MTAHACPQCGAQYESSEDSCDRRFQALLALDHSRREPWGSRHGSAFAAFALQHPAGRSPETLQTCWTMLYRIWISGETAQVVVQDLRRAQAGNPAPSTVPPLRVEAWPVSFRTTVADLGEFEAASYPAHLEAWCRATLEALAGP